MSAPAPEARRSWRRAPRWLKIGFAAALALNFLLIGLGVGALMRIEAHGLRDGRHFALGHMIHALPEDQRAAARARLSDQRAAFEGLRAERRAARAALADSLAAPAFDPVAAEAAFARYREADIAVRQAVHGAMTRLMADLTPEARAALAERLRKPRWRHRRGDGAHGGGPRDE